MCVLGIWCVALAACAATPQVNVISKGFPGRNSRQALVLLEKEVLPFKPQHAASVRTARPRCIRHAVSGTFQGG